MTNHLALARMHARRAEKEQWTVEIAAMASVLGMEMRIVCPDRATAEALFEKSMKRAREIRDALQ